MKTYFYVSMTGLQNSDNERMFASGVYLCEKKALDIAQVIINSKKTYDWKWCAVLNFFPISKRQAKKISDGLNYIGGVVKK